MSNVKVQNMYEAYQHTLLNILQTPCNLDDTDIDKISNLILTELFLVGKNQCIQTEGLQFQVIPLVQQAKNVNNERKIAFKTNERKTRGLHTFSIRDHCVVIYQNNFTNILKEIRLWLCDFGDKYNTFNLGIWGTHSQVGDELDRVEKKLKVTSLMPKIVVQKLSIGNLWEPDDLYDRWWRAWRYVQVPPIQVEFLFHEPTSVTGSLITQDIMFTLDNLTFKASMPSYSKTMTVVFEGELEYTVTRGVYGRRWAKIITFGNVVDKVKTLKKIERVTMSMECNAEKIKVIQKINSDSAKRFLNLYKTCKSFDTLEQVTLPVRYDQLQVDCHESFRAYVTAMREGGHKAINEMVSKKAEVLQNLPKDMNNVAGIAYEELQIAQIMAEAHKREIPLKLHVGDGRSRFKFRGELVSTPEYVDAVFYNTKSKIYYAVQFKFTTEPLNLLEMMTKWTKTDHSAPLGTMPDVCFKNNVQLIGPKDVVDKLSPEERKRFKNKIDIGFEQVPLESKAVIKFIKDNTEALKNIVNGDIVKMINKQASDLRSIDTKVERFRHKISKLQVNLAKNAQNPQRQEPIQGEIDRLQGNLNNFQQRHGEIQQEFEKSNIALQTQIKTEMKKSILKNGCQHILISTAIGVATDGVIFLVTSGYTEMKKYCNDITSARQCVWNIFYKTSAVVARGIIKGGARNVAEVAGQYADYAVGGTTGKVFSNLVNLVGPSLMIGMVSKSTFEIFKQYNDDKITYTQFKRTILQITIPSLVSTIGTKAVQSLIRGPLGVALGAGVFIAVAVGDFYLGETLWGLFIKEDPAERHEFLKRKENEICENVLKDAYTLLELKQDASDDQLKEQFRKTLTHYQNLVGDKEEILNAIEAAYSVIKDRRAPQSTDTDRRP